MRKKARYIATLMSGDEALYDVMSYKGHVFRLYPDGQIGKADEQERMLATNNNRR